MILLSYVNSELVNTLNLTLASIFSELHITYLSDNNNTYNKTARQGICYVNSELVNSLNLTLASILSELHITEHCNKIDKPARLTIVPDYYLSNQI